MKIKIAQSTHRHSHHSRFFSPSGEGAKILRSDGMITARFTAILC
jgi:hypothetical protein